MNETQTSIDPKKFNWLEKLELKVGSHKQPNGEACIMEAVSFLAGEKWSDSPQCASPVIAAFLRYFNDRVDHKTRQRLKPYAPRLVDSRASQKVEGGRALLACDWAIRFVAPAWLRLTPRLKPHMDALRALPPFGSP